MNGPLSYTLYSVRQAHRMLLHVAHKRACSATLCALLSQSRDDDWQGLTLVPADSTRAETCSGPMREKLHWPKMPSRVSSEISAWEYQKSTAPLLSSMGSVQALPACNASASQHAASQFWMPLAQVHSTPGMLARAWEGCFCSVDTKIPRSPRVASMQLSALWAGIRRQVWDTLSSRRPCLP